MVVLIIFFFIGYRLQDVLVKYMLTVGSGEPTSETAAGSVSTL